MTFAGYWRTNRMRPLFVISASGSVAAVAIILGVIAGTGEPRAAELKTCPDITHIRVAVGSAVFSVPRTYDFEVSGRSIPPNFIEKRFCPKRPDSVLAVHGLTFQRANDYSSHEYKEAAIKGVQIRLRSRNRSYRKPKDRYEFFVIELGKKALSVDALPTMNGFRAYEVERGTNVYFAYDNTTTIESIPLVITCGSPALILRGENLGRSCSTGFYAVSESVAVRYVFRDAIHGIETWTDLDARVRKFVRRLEIHNQQ